jgi:putative ABC transport system substrate-binding protein
MAPHILAGLKDLGHEVGRTLLLERRSADGDNARFPALARELLEYKPAVMLAPCGYAQRAIREISRTVPLVALCADEKNFLGEVASLHRPGGATTGITFLAPESAGKRLEILKEIRPDLRRVGVLYQSGEDWENYWREIERAAPKLGLAVVRFPIKHAEDLEHAFAEALRERADALLVFPDATTFGVARRIAEFALKYRLATAFDFARFADAGGLVSYSADLKELGRVVSRHIDSILKGAKPGSLPVVQPSKFELVINLRTAKALGLTIPPSLLGRADRVIE